MIIKLRQEMDWGNYESTGRVIRAIRLLDDFLYETCHGWVQGYKGQWLIECGESMRCALDDEAFRRHYLEKGTGG